MLMLRRVRSIRTFTGQTVCLYVGFQLNNSRSNIIEWIVDRLTTRGKKLLDLSFFFITLLLIFFKISILLKVYTELKKKARDHNSEKL